MLQFFISHFTLVDPSDSGEDLDAKVKGTLKKGGAGKRKKEGIRSFLPLFKLHVRAFSIHLGAWNMRHAHITPAEHEKVR